MAFTLFGLSAVASGLVVLLGLWRLGRASRSGRFAYAANGVVLTVGGTVAAGLFGALALVGAAVA